MRFSIIIPVYKTEQYVKQCVDSVLSQSYTDFELILVDNESPDNCPQICDDYAKKELENGTTMQTFRSYSTFIHGNHLTFMNLTFENTAGKGSEVGQAIASYVDGDCIHFKNCRFLISSSR